MKQIDLPNLCVNLWEFIYDRVMLRLHDVIPFNLPDQVPWPILKREDIVCK